jgi:hypothetical protein
MSWVDGRGLPIRHCFYLVKNANKLSAHRCQGTFLFTVVMGVCGKCIVFFFMFLVFLTHVGVSCSCHSSPSLFPRGPLRNDVSSYYIMYPISNTDFPYLFG